MTISPSEVEIRMRALVQRWEEASDRRAVFLRCYLLMTDNVLAAIAAGEFYDAAWVHTLLHQFAGYYFAALEAYERDQHVAPPWWRIAFDTAQNPSALVLHHLLLGVNAHITYDLVLATADVLAPEWASLSEGARELRHADYTHVNHVIGRTIDAVQDEIIDRAMPGMVVVDKMLGPVDEWMISHLIAHWRDSVWRETTHLIETADPQERIALLEHIEAETMRRANAILGHDGLRSFRDLL
jgi:hypothetical protein